jgi:hypothetical protein
MRRLVTLGGPALFLLMTLAHPRPEERAIAPALAPQVDRWLGVHLAGLLLIPLVAIAIWLLLEELGGLAAAVSRCALAFFVALYAAFDGIVGVGTGVLVRHAGGMTGPDARAVSAQLVQAFWDGRLDPRGPVLWVILAADLAWLVALFAAARAHHRAGAPAVAVGLLLVAGAAFAIDHTWPAGTIGMAALLGAAALLTAAARPAPTRR